MKLSSLKIDSAKVEAGAWVDNIVGMDDLRLKVRGIGNSDWRRLQGKLIDKVPRAQRIGGRIDPNVQDSIITECLVETVLVGWANILGEDGTPLPYSREKARELLSDPDMAAFRDAVIAAAGSVADQGAATTEEAAKNSEAPSNGISGTASSETGSST